MSQVDNPYFKVASARRLSSVEELLSLNIEKSFNEPGKEGFISNPLSPYTTHSTAGLFRGQLYNWPLIPRSFRSVAELTEPSSEIAAHYRWAVSTHDFRSFCKRAEAQNAGFPASDLERMCLAQHFGVDTPLLDWSKSVLAALFFAIRDVFSDAKFEEKLRVYIYHVRDERLLGPTMSQEEDLGEVRHSSFVKPTLTDRRIERQRGVFTFHPHPLHAPAKVPIDVYVLGFRLAHKLIELMQGFGFTEDYYFPDYAGIAHAVKSGTSL